MKFGVIGCGKQAPKHISGLRSAGIEEIVVTDVDRNSIDRLLSSDHYLQVSEDVDSLLADPDLVGVSICTPTPTHAPLVRKSISYGKHFLCEKPLCEDLSEASALHRAAEKAGLIGMVGYVYRFVPAFEVAREILKDAPTTGHSNVLGRVTNAFLRIGGRGSHALWKHQRATGGGAINEMMVHMIDLATWLFGKPVKAELLKSTQRWPTRQIGGQVHEVDAEDWTLATLTCESNIEVLIQADFITPAFTQFVEVQGENGYFFGSIQSSMQSYVYCVEPGGEYYAGRTDLTTKPVNLFEAQMSAFVDAIRIGKVPDRGSISDALAVMETLEQLRT